MAYKRKSRRQNRKLSRRGLGSRSSNSKGSMHLSDLNKTRKHHK